MCLPHSDNVTVNTFTSNRKEERKISFTPLSFTKQYHQNVYVGVPLHIDLRHP